MRRFLWGVFIFFAAVTFVAGLATARTFAQSGGAAAGGGLSSFVVFFSEMAKGAQGAGQQPPASPRPSPTPTRPATARG